MIIIMNQSIYSFVHRILLVFLLGTYALTLSAADNTYWSTPLHGSAIAANATIPLSIGVPAGVAGTDYVVNYTALVNLEYTRANLTDVGGSTWSKTIVYKLYNLTNATYSPNMTLTISNTDVSGVFEQIGVHEMIASNNMSLQVISSTEVGNPPADIKLNLGLKSMRLSILQE